MQLCSGSVSVHCHEGACQDGEYVQFMAVNPKGTILAVLTQLRIHFWSAGPKISYLTSLNIPGTSLADNPALYVLWRQQGTHLAVVSTRHIAFFESDINLTSSDFLHTIERKRDKLELHHVDSASRVCHSGEVPIATGLVTSAVAAGLYAFLVTTTAGVVYVVGWHKQDILHQWTTVGLQGGGHTFQCTTQEVGGTFSPAADSEADLAVTGMAPVSSLSSVAKRVSRRSSSPLSRVDPLQRPYHGNPGVPFLDAMFDSTKHTVLAASSSAGIRPPGIAVRGHQMSLCPNDAATTSSPLPDSEVPNTAAPLENKETEGSAVDGRSVSAVTVTNTTSMEVKPQSCQPSKHLFGPFPCTNGAPAPAGQRSAGAERLSGTILHATFASRLRVLSFVFSSGSVLLCRTSCGTNFTHEKVGLQGCVTPIVSACMVAINVRHFLLAVCTQGGAISCRRIDGTTLAVRPKPLWKGLRGVSDAVFKLPSVASSTSQSLGLIAGMEWSPSEELLCVAFYKHGMVLVHYSGGVVTRHLSGPANASLSRTPQVPVTDSPHSFNNNGADARSGKTCFPPLSCWQENEVALGCSAVTWKPDGTRLWMAAPRQTCFFSTQVSRLLTVDTVGPTSGNHSPLALLADNALYLVSVSEATTAQGVCETALPPDDYLREQYPLSYGAVSSDGSWLVCAGRRGLAIFNRERHSWSVASKEVEESITCVADPVWLRDVATVVPTRRTDTRSFELTVFSASTLSPALTAARVELDGRPAQLSCVHQDHRGDGFVVVVDCSQTVHVFRYDIFIDAATRSSSPGPYVALTPVQRLVLTNGLSNPLCVIPVCLRRDEPDRQLPNVTQAPSELSLLLHKRGDHTLVWLRGKRHAAGHALIGATDRGSNDLTSTNNSLPHMEVIAEQVDPDNKRFVFRCWVDRTAPVRGVVLLTHEEEQGLVVYQVLETECRSAETVTSVTYRMEVAATQCSESLPLCPSPFDGYMLGIATDTSAPRPSSHRFVAGAITSVGQASPRPQLALRPILYAHRILSLLLLTAMPSSFVPPRVSHGQDVSTSSAGLIPSPPSRFEEAAAEVDESVIAFIWDRSLFHWLERMRLNDTFSAVLDYFLHTALNESPPAAVPGLGRRSAVRATISLLRNYPEFYAIVVGCVRKIDFTRWHLVLDFLGTPMDLFHECVTHHCYAEAVHLVRIIMMGSYNAVAGQSSDRLAVTESGGSVLGHNDKDVTPLQQASQCAVELFVLSVENGNYTAAYDVMRFMALLEEEIGMPVAGGLDFYGGSGGGAEESASSSEGFLTRWLRHLTFRRPILDDAGAAATAQDGNDKAENGLCRDSVTGLRRIEGYSTLAFDVTRGNSTQSGRVSEETQRQVAVHHMFRLHQALPDAVHREALRLLRTGYVTQLAKLMETFSFSVVEFLRAVHLPSSSPVASTAATVDAVGEEERRHFLMPCLCDIFDGLHKELGLPRGFSLSVGSTPGTGWYTWLVEQQAAHAAALPGVLGSTNPRVWTVAQSALYASPSLLHSVESLHQLFAPIFVYDLAFCVLLMRKSNLLLLLMSHEESTHAPARQAENVTTELVSKSGSASMELIRVLAHLDALLAVPENAGYKPFLHDVFLSLPPSALHAITPRAAPRAGVVDAASHQTDAALTDAME
ncbi:hypothetical protein JKF63_02439 [Porcisia hertigi]|uniref:RIC1 C-terminal alpha solenoid region domain-containing protein n=1 Tax=Porcisia hertigi TaxID=2761500 RepID=A0A836IJS1_9TRYP|nr:hypothetical protein JKF63_02439 [Porcisia hertigi]